MYPQDLLLCSISSSTLSPHLFSLKDGDCWIWFLVGLALSFDTWMASFGLAVVSLSKNGMLHATSKFTGFLEQSDFEVILFLNSQEIRMSADWVELSLGHIWWLLGIFFSPDPLRPFFWEDFSYFLGNFRISIIIQGLDISRCKSRAEKKAMNGLINSDLAHLQKLLEVKILIYLHFPNWSSLIFFWFVCWENPGDFCCWFGIYPVARFLLVQTVCGGILLIFFVESLSSTILFDKSRNLISQISLSFLCLEVLLLWSSLLGWNFQGEQELVGR